MGGVFYRLERHADEEDAFEKFLQIRPDAPFGDQIRAYLERIRR